MGGRISTPVTRADRVVRPYAPCHCEEYPKGTCFAARSDAAIRSQRGTAALTGREDAVPYGAVYRACLWGTPKKLFFPNS